MPQELTIKMKWLQHVFPGSAKHCEEEGHLCLRRVCSLRVPSGKDLGSSEDSR